jgi:ATP-dependent Clp protease adaptor protein ClpS
MAIEPQPQGDTVLEEQKSPVKPPPMFRVLLLNDDYTPMAFVVTVLQSFFAMNRERATRVMLDVHQSGKGVCGVYSRDIATTKVAQVSAYARRHQHPLACTMEPE